MSHAISLAPDMWVVFEMDSQLLVEALNINKVDSSTYAAVIEDTKYQLKLWFSYYEINVYRRSANSVAHELGSLGRMLESNQYLEWEVDVPAFVAASALGDST